MGQESETDVLSPYAWIFLIAVAAVITLFVVAEWRILKKAGEKGWKALIPFYDVYVSHHIVGMSHVWFVLEVIAWVCEIVIEIVKFPEPVVITFGIATGAFTLLSEIIHVLKMCNCFGKGKGFKIGMILIPNLFTLILAFGKSQYTKPEH